MMIMLQNDFAYVVSLAGKHVFHDWSIQCVITHIDDLDKVRVKIKERHHIEFEEKSAQFMSGYWKFDNITDNRDIHLIVERVDVVE